MKREAFPKTVVYTKLKWCGYAHEMALRPDMDGNSSNIDAFIAQYHQPCTKQVFLFLPKKKRERKKDKEESLLPVSRLPQNQNEKCVLLIFQFFIERKRKKFQIFYQNKLKSVTLY